MLSTTWKILLMNSQLNRIDVSVDTYGTVAFFFFDDSIPENLLLIVLVLSPG